jgi:hypothetical protein
VPNSTAFLEKHAIKIRDRQVTVKKKPCKDLTRFHGTHRRKQGGFSMKTYPIPMVPGPVRVPRPILDAYGTDFGSADLEPEFFDLYDRCEAGLRRIMATENRIVIQSGEGMLALWSALNSCLEPRDRVLSVGTGVFGDGSKDLPSL